MLLLWLISMNGGQVLGQCSTTNIAGNLTPANGDTLSGIYNVTGNFTIPLGVTVYVRPYAQNACGRLEVFAGGDINILGTIQATGAGLPGGGGGAAGSANNVGMIETCISTGTCDIFTYGGASGGDGSITPGGGGEGGVTGIGGSGRNNTCNLFGDETGRVGGSGGAGAGGGAAYGGIGTSGQNGASGTVPTVSTSDNVSCSSNPIVAGGSAVGGATGIAYGTPTGTDIDLGSGGGGAGGGGRGRTAGTSGQAGGNGGGLIRLESAGNMTLSGDIIASGGNGGIGGNGGNAGTSPRCCGTDLCHETDEHTHTGAGGGGGGGGGGSGGGVLLKIGGIANISGNIYTRGGNGGTGGIGGQTYFQSLSTGFFCGSTTTTGTAPTALNGGLGGAGGGGRIKIFYNECAPSNSVFPNLFVNGGTGAFGNGFVGSTYISSDGSMVAGNATPATQTVCYAGDPGPLTSAATTGGFGPITYQWQYQPNCTGTWLNIPGADTLIYNPPAGLLQNTCYRLVSLSSGCIRYSDTLTVFVQSQLATSILPVGPSAVCQGDTVSMAVTVVPGATYQWNFNGLPISGATDTVFSATQNGAYSVEVTFPNGCQALSAQSVVQILPPPPAFVSPMGSTILCPGSSVTINGLGGGFYQWFANGNPIVGAVTNSITVDSAGIYAVQVTNSAGCVSLSSGINVTVGSVPTASASAIGDTVFCSGDSVLLVGNGGGSYQWLLYNAAIPGANAQVFAANATGNYSVVVTNSQGCKDTSSTIPVSVTPTPVAGIYPLGTFNVCAGDSVLFTASGGGSYQWMYNQQALTNDTTQFLLGTIPGDYTVIVTGAGGCSDTSQTLALTWYPPLQPQIQPQGPHFLCPGDTVTLSVTGFNIAGWQWEKGDTAIPGATGPVLNATQLGAYNVVVYDTHGCSYSSGIVVVNPGSDPLAAIEIISPYPGCGNDTLWLQGRGGGTYQWLESGNPIAGANDSLLGVLADGDYSVVVANGCGTDTSGWLPIYLIPGPTANFLWNNLADYGVEFIDSSISGATWLWDFGDGSSSVQQDPQHTYGAFGQYTVTMITWDIFGCSDTITYVVEVKNPDFYIPNVFTPNGDGINDVAWTDFSNLDDFEFMIFDRWGVQVFITSTQNTRWDGNIDGRPAADGVYYYRLYGSKIGEEGYFQVQGTITLLR